MLSCRESARLMSDSMETRLSFGRRLALRLHLLMCSLCRRYRKQIRRVDRIARAWDAAPPEGPSALGSLSPEAQERMRALLR